MERQQVVTFSDLSDAMRDLATAKHEVDACKSSYDRAELELDAARTARSRAQTRVEDLFARLQGQIDA